MEKNEHDKIIAFDTLYTNNHIQMMKIVMPYFDEPMPTSNIWNSSIPLNAIVLILMN